MKYVLSDFSKFILTIHSVEICDILDGDQIEKINELNVLVGIASLWFYNRQERFAHEKT